MRPSCVLRPASYVFDRDTNPPVWRWSTIHWILPPPHFSLPSRTRRCEDAGRRTQDENAYFSCNFAKDPSRADGHRLAHGYTIETKLSLGTNTPAYDCEDAGRRTQDENAYFSCNFAKDPSRADGHRMAHGYTIETKRSLGTNTSAYDCEDAGRRTQDAGRRTQDAGRRTKMPISAAFSQSPLASPTYDEYEKSACV